ncbi:YceI family protein [Dyadobacter subterraneus]|uniref:YceI family protein n=1 Tax=Dyadobacter subterraneus TaxID=2773304 RepID=A0ABR9W494_9BACT|nr:YceI family protein [Dyadobacter subterraneus]MBE9460271.1 YceI family protein [Dyadobacter subterraneus]
MKKIFVFALVGLWVNAAAIAGGPAKSKAADKTLSIDTKASKVVWVGKKVTGEHTGNVPISSGTLILDKDKLKGGSFVLDTKSLTVTDLTDNDSNGKLTGHLKGADFFAVDKYPTSKLDITSVTAKGANVYDVTGKLTIKGITSDITFPATVKADGKSASATAKITIDRTKYDIKFRSTNFFENLGDKAISNDFVLDVNLIAK